MEWNIDQEVFKTCKVVVRSIHLFINFIRNTTDELSICSAKMVLLHADRLNMRRGKFACRST